ncbi:MAG: RNA methyltransferase [Lachnospiraceae bacterium]|nr:RNA methyltransferase [Lachnospiraceae bacterium]
MPNIIHISDFHCHELDIYARLSENDLLSRHKPEEGIFVAESPNVIERALNAGCTPISILIEERELPKEASKIIQRPQCQNIPIFTASYELLSQLTGFQLTRGMLCAMKRPALPSVTEICQNARRITVLENVVNPTNIGAIFRSAAALNMDAVLLTAGCSNPLYRRASRVSMGTVFQIPWTYICPHIPKKSPENLKYKQTNTKPPVWEKDGIHQLHELGFKTVAMALTDNSVSIDDPDLQKEKKLAIILGTEGDGLAASTIAECDYTVKIPMSHGVDSLNVAAASAVAFWELGK